MCVCVCVQSHYNSGVKAYSDEDWLGTIRHMEQAQTEFYQAVERCELLCEGPFDHESLPDFYNAIAG